MEKKSRALIAAISLIGLCQGIVSASASDLELPAPSPSTTPPKDGESRASLIGVRVVRFFARRISQINIGAVIPASLLVPNREFKMLAAFDATGAMVYNQELPKRRFDSEHHLIESIPQLDRTQGVQLMPYTVSVLSSGKVMVSAGIFGFRNQNSFAPIRPGTRTFGHFVESADLLVYEYDGEMTYDNLVRRTLKAGTVTFGYPFVSESETKVLALTGGGELNWTQSRLRLESGQVIEIGRSDDGTGKVFNPELHLGVKFDEYRMAGDGHLGASINLSHSRMQGRYRDDRSPDHLAAMEQYAAAQAQYEADIRAWAAAHDLSQYTPEELQACFGPPPVAPMPPSRKVKGLTTMLSSSITYDRPLHAVPSADPTSLTGSARIGATVKASVPVCTNFRSESFFQNQLNTLNNFVTFGLFMRW